MSPSENPFRLGHPSGPPKPPRRRTPRTCVRPSFQPPRSTSSPTSARLAWYHALRYRRPPAEPKTRSARVLQALTISFLAAPPSTAAHRPALRKHEARRCYKRSRFLSFQRPLPRPPAGARPTSPFSERLLSPAADFNPGGPPEPPPEIPIPEHSHPARPPPLPGFSRAKTGGGNRPASRKTSPPAHPRPAVMPLAVPACRQIAANRPALRPAAIA